MLRVLCEHQTTADIDIVFSQDPDNVNRLVDALRGLHAVYKDPLGRRIEPDAARFSSRHGGGHHLLATSAGNLDVLRQSHDWDAVLDMKTKSGRPKDRLGIIHIEAAIAARGSDDED